MIGSCEGYAAELRKQAIQLYVDGLSFRWIARYLGEEHQTVANCVKAHAATLPASPPLPPLPADTSFPVIEMDTFAGEKICSPVGATVSMFYTLSSCVTGCSQDSCVCLESSPTVSSRPSSLSCSCLSILLPVIIATPFHHFIMTF